MFQALTVRAGLHGDRDAVFRAAMLDRHAASVLTRSQIRAMTEELIEANAAWLPVGLRGDANSRANNEILHAAANLNRLAVGAN